MKDLTFHSQFIEGIHVHMLPVDKFKTNLISVHIHLPLQEETVTLASLLPHVMRRGSQRYPDMTAIQRHLNELYGAEFHVEVNKKGEKQYIVFQMEILNEQFISEEIQLLEEGFAFLGEMIYAPLLEGEGFARGYVELEKESLRKKIEGLIDDKMRYANQRLTEEMCKDEPYRLLAQGIKEQIPDLTAEQLYGFYQKVIETYPIDVYIVGNFAEEKALHYIDKYFSRGKGEKQTVPPTDYQRKGREEKVVTEEMDVSQGKLNIGLRTHINFAEDEYMPLMMYNGVLGGFPHSKLFTNVREKASLAYYAVSRLESSKGLMMIMSGIESDNFDKAVKIIKEQLKMMADGEISDLEIQQTKAALGNQFQESFDSARGLIEFDYLGQLNGKARSLTETIQGLENISKEDIMAVGKKIELDTIYFLRGKGEEK